MLPAPPARLAMANVLFHLLCLFSNVCFCLRQPGLLVRLCFDISHTKYMPSWLLVTVLRHDLHYSSHRCGLGSTSAQQNACPAVCLRCFLTLSVWCRARGVQQGPPASPALANVCFAVVLSILKACVSQATRATGAPLLPLRPHKISAKLDTGR